MSILPSLPGVMVHIQTTCVNDTGRLPVVMSELVEPFTAALFQGNSSQVSHDVLNRTQYSFLTSVCEGGVFKIYYIPMPLNLGAIFEPYYM